MMIDKRECERNNDRKAKEVHLVRFFVHDVGATWNFSNLYFSVFENIVIFQSEFPNKSIGRQLDQY